MTQIIDFRSYAGRRPTRDHASPDGAQILFFLGVRYERMPDSPPAAPVPAERPARRARSRKSRG